MPKSPDIWQNANGDISNLRVSSQSLTNKNCCNSRASNDIDMKFGAVTKLDKRNMTVKKIDYDVMLAHCDIIVIFSYLCPILSNPEARFWMHGL